MKRQSQCGGSHTYFLYVLYNWRTVFVSFVQLEKGSTGSPPSQSYTDRWANIQLHLIFLFWSGQSRNHSWGMCVLLLRIYGLGYHKPLLYVAHCTHDCQIFVLASVTVWIGDQSLCSCLICFKELTKAGGHLWWSAFSNRFIPHVRTSTVYHHIMNSKHGSPELDFVKKTLCDRIAIEMFCMKSKDIICLALATAYLNSRFHLPSFLFIPWVVYPNHQIHTRTVAIVIKTS